MDGVAKLGFADEIGSKSMTEKKPTVAALLRKIGRLEAQLQAARDFNLRISACDMDLAIKNADMREQLRQIAEIAQGVEL